MPRDERDMYCAYRKHVSPLSHHLGTASSKFWRANATSSGRQQQTSVEPVPCCVTCGRTPILVTTHTMMSTRVTAAYPYTSDPDHFDSCIRVIKGDYHTWIFTWTWIVHIMPVHIRLYSQQLRNVSVHPGVYGVCVYVHTYLHSLVLTLSRSLSLTPSFTHSHSSITYTHLLRDHSLIHSITRSLTYLLPLTHPSN